MDFLAFCRACGVILDRYPPEGRWVRVPTEDKPRSKNGAVKWMVGYGLCQNWATQTEPSIWRDDGATKDATRRVQAVATAADREARELAARAAQKAERLLSECELAPHPYTERKGFPDALVNVWNRDAENKMVVPMRRGAQLVGCQTITPDGDKKFLFGQRSGGATFVMGQRGINVLCEGYATALSAQQALRQLKVPYVLHVTFSAGNMKKVSADLEPGLVLADNDASGTGERVAREIGWPYWMSDTVGEDFNDAHQRRGIFPLAMELKAHMHSGRLRA